MSVASMSTSSLFWVVRRKILSRAPPVFSRSARITHHAHHVSIWPSGEVVFQQRLIPFVFCALPRPGITSLPCPSGIPLSLASFLFADPAAVLSRCPPSALRVPQAARRLAASLLRALPRNGALRSPYLASLSLSRPRWRLLPPLRVLQVSRVLQIRSPGVPSLSAADDGRFDGDSRSGISASPALRRARVLGSSVSMCDWPDVLSRCPNPCSPGVPDARRWPREGPPHSWCVWSRRPKAAPELPS